MGDYISYEVSLFLEAAYYGIILGISYDILRVFRRIFKHKNFFVYIEDYLFWVIWGVLIFAFIFNYNDGIVRGYIFGAFLIGALLYTKSFSGFLVKYVSKIADFIVSLLLKKPIKVIKIYISKFKTHIKKGIKGLYGHKTRKKKE